MFCVFSAVVFVAQEPSKELTTAGMWPCLRDMRVACATDHETLTCILQSLLQVSTFCATLCTSLSAVGKHALLAHDGCTRVLRHHALIAEDVEVGGPCRGALAAMEGRRSAGTATSSAARAAGAGHLMISCARASALAMCSQARMLP